MTIYLRWRDESDELHVTSAPAATDHALDMTNAAPLRAGMQVEVNGVRLILADPGAA